MCLCYNLMNFQDDLVSRKFVLSMKITMSDISYKQLCYNFTIWSIKDYISLGKNNLHAHPILSKNFSSCSRTSES